MSSANVTRQVFSLGAEDPTSGQYKIEYNTSETIKMVIMSRGANFQALAPGLYARYEISGLTSNVVSEGDLITDSFNDTYKIMTAKKIWWLDNFIGYECELAPYRLDP